MAKRILLVVFIVLLTIYASMAVIYPLSPISFKQKMTYQPNQKIKQQYLDSLNDLSKINQVTKKEISKQTRKELDNYFTTKTILIDQNYFKKMYSDLDTLEKKIASYVSSHKKITPANKNDFDSAITLIDSVKESIVAYTKPTFNSQNAIKNDLALRQQDFLMIAKLIIVALNQ